MPALVVDKQTRQDEAERQDIGDDAQYTFGFQAYKDVQNVLLRGHDIDSPEWSLVKPHDKGFPRSRIRTYHEGGRGASSDVGGLIDEG